MAGASNSPLISAGEATIGRLDWRLMQRGAQVSRAGGTSSHDFPTTSRPYQRGKNIAALFLPQGDVFVAKFGEPSAAGPNVTISAAANAANYDASAIAPGEIIAITGTSIGPAVGVLAGPSDGVFPTQLAETRVLISGKPAPILYASGRQVNAIVPWGVTAATAEIVVEYQGVQSRALTLPVASSAPGLFSVNDSGLGQAKALNQDLSLNSAANPVDPGSIIVLYGTGTGRTVPPSVDGGIAVVARPELPVNATIGGQRVDVLYAGAAPGLVAGVLQLNLRLPEAIAAGNQPVVVRIGERTSQTGLTIAVR